MEHWMTRLSKIACGVAHSMVVRFARVPTQVKQLK